MHLKSFVCVEQTSPQNGLSEEALLNALFNSRALKVSPLHYGMCTAAPWMWEQKQNNKGKRLSLLNPNDFHSFSKLHKHLTMENIKSNFHNIWIYNYRGKETFYTLKACLCGGTGSTFAFNWNHRSLVMVKMSEVQTSM